MKLIEIWQEIRATNSLFYNSIQNLNVEIYFALSNIKKMPSHTAFLFKTTQIPTDIIIGSIFRLKMLKSEPNTSLIL